MQAVSDIWGRIVALLSSGIAGSQVTPLRLLVVVTLTVALIWSSRKATRWLVDSVLARRGLDVGMRESVGVILRYAIVVLGALVILQSAGIDLTSLNVLVGAIGVGLGFGLQNITSNFFSGLILLFERPLRVGDRIEIGGVTGEVREIGARATTLVTDENVATLVPNSQLVSERVTNWSRPGRLTAYLLPFHVSYASDPLLVRKILLAAASAHKGVLTDPAPEVEFGEVGPATLRFQLQVWSVDHLKTSGTLKSDLNFAAWRQLIAAGIDMQPRRDGGAFGLEVKPR
jgi:small-conductance mechanosensitive channel